MVYGDNETPPSYSYAEILRKKGSLFSFIKPRADTAAGGAGTGEAGAAGEGTSASTGAGAIAAQTQETNATANEQRTQPQPPEEEEMDGLDKSECGMEAYPEFR